jgi:hypothetical protein
MKQVEIFFSDLVPEKQDELLAAVGVDSPEEMNWDTFAVAVCDFEEDDTEEEGYIDPRYRDDNADC